MKKDRNPCANEVASFKCDDGKRCYAIVKREDGHFAYQIDLLQYDDENDSYYWNTISNSPTGVYATALLAENEARAHWKRWRERLGA